MDLGATLCSRTRPTCSECPWTKWCRAYVNGDQVAYPKKEKKKPTPIRFGHVYVLRSGGHVLVQQRPDTGLLGGMLGLPTSEWGEKPTDHSAAPMHRNWQKAGEIKHVFTHFELRLDVFQAETDEQGKGLWSEKISGLPTVFQKAVSVTHKKTGPLGPVDKQKPK